MRSFDEIVPKLNDLIDGRLGPVEEREVRDLIARDESVARRYRELRLVVGGLGDLKGERAPPDFTDRVMATIEGAAPRIGGPRLHGLARYGAVAAGLLAVLVLGLLCFRDSLVIGGRVATESAHAPEAAAPSPGVVLGQQGHDRAAADQWDDRADDEDVLSDLGRGALVRRDGAPPEPSGRVTAEEKLARLDSEGHDDDGERRPAPRSKVDKSARRDEKFGRDDLAKSVTKESTTEDVENAGGAVVEPSGRFSALRLDHDRAVLLMRTFVGALDSSRTDGPESKSVGRSAPEEFRKREAPARSSADDAASAPAQGGVAVACGLFRPASTEGAAIGPSWTAILDGAGAVELTDAAFADLIPEESRPAAQALVGDGRRVRWLVTDANGLARIAENARSLGLEADAIDPRRVDGEVAATDRTAKKARESDAALPAAVPDGGAATIGPWRIVPAGAPRAPMDEPSGGLVSPRAERVRSGALPGAAATRSAAATPQYVVVIVVADGP